jgi:hypothetical protein
MPSGTLEILAIALGCQGQISTYNMPSGTLEILAIALGWSNTHTRKACTVTGFASDKQHWT